MFEGVGDIPGVLGGSRGSVGSVDNKDSIVQELRLNVQGRYWYSLNTTAVTVKSPVVLMTNMIGI